MEVELLQKRRISFDVNSDCFHDEIFQPLKISAHEARIQKYRQNQNLMKIKRIILGGLTTIFLVYWLLFDGSQADCFNDVLLNMLEPVNYSINHNESAAYWHIVIAQVIIDSQMLLLMLICTFRVKNLTAQAFIGTFYAIRAFFIIIELFPYPEGVYWEAPGFPPSLGVPYGVTRDFYYSGHTGMMIFCCLWWNRLGFKYLSYFTVICIFQVIFVLLATRVHYTIDVIGGIIFGLWLNTFWVKNVIYFDKLFTFFYLIIIKSIDLILFTFRRIKDRV